MEFGKSSTHRHLRVSVGTMASMNSLKDVDLNTRRNWMSFQEQLSTLLFDTQDDCSTSKNKEPATAILRYA